MKAIAVAVAKNPQATSFVICKPSGISGFFTNCEKWVVVLVLHVKSTSQLARVHRDNTTSCQSKIELSTPFFENWKQRQNFQLSGIWILCRNAEYVVLGFYVEITKVMSMNWVIVICNSSMYVQKYARARTSVWATAKSYLKSTLLSLNATILVNYPYP